jgi:hypothetical protein
LSSWSMRQLDKVRRIVEGVKPDLAYSGTARRKTLR